MSLKGSEKLEPHNKHLVDSCGGRVCICSLQLVNGLDGKTTKHNGTSSRNEGFSLDFRFAQCNWVLCICSHVLFGCSSSQVLAGNQKRALPHILCGIFHT